jgi:hypothetical protein
MTRERKLHGVRFQTPPEVFAKTVRAQRAYLRKLADAIERGDELVKPLDREMVVVVLRAHADGMSESQRRPRGKAPQFDHGQAAMVFAALVVHKGCTENQAYERCAEDYGVSITAIKNAIEPYKVSAFCFNRIPGMTFGFGEDETKSRE